MSHHSLSALSENLAGRYTIERELGAGGMATVYLAHDVRHDRRVALKVLRPELAAVIGAERFLREIRTTANLQHPHILPLFDSGEAGSQLFYVMPLVEGESLRDRLDHEKQLGVEESVRIASEVAAALDYAHRHGVVHRDVKPANILLHDGSALVTDFGIALAIRNAGADRITETGLSLGTPHYMSPEQATGDRDIGARSDIYSLAAVLYECLAGEPPHSGGTIQAVIAKVLTEVPRPLGDLRGSVPVHVAMAVEQALAKVPADRFPTAAAFADALRNPSATAARIIGATAARRVAAPARPGTLAAIAAAALTLGAVGGWSLRRPGPPATPPVVWFDIVADSGLIADPPAISPDGSAIVYSVGGTDGSVLYLRRLDALTVTQLPGTTGAQLPFFSPDGRSIAFVANNQLRTLRLDGGTPITVARISQFFMGGTWAPDNTILFTQYPQSGLYRVNATGGPTERIGFADDSSGFPNAPSMLPGGMAILLAIDYARGYEVASFDLATGSIKRYGRGSSPQFVAPGWIVFGRDGGRLYRQRFDATKRDTIGGPEPILNSVNYDVTTDIYYYGVGPNGSIATVTGASSITDISLVDRVGNTRVLLSANNSWAPRFSPDGRRIAYGAIASGRSQSDVWLYDLGNGNSQRLTLDAKQSNDPVWNPNGREVMFSAHGDTSIKDLYVQSVDNLGSARLVLRRPGTQWNSDWSRDGRSMVFTDVADTSSWDIWSMTVGDTASAKPFLATTFQETAARLSPDSKWIAYHSDETGKMEVYVQSFPVPGSKMLVSTDGGRDPVWRADGKELYYWQANRLIAATLTTAGSVTVTRREPLFQLQTYVLGAHANYDVSPDGGSFAIVTGAVASKVSVGLNVVR